MAGRPAVSVDFAGNARLLGAIHEHLGDALAYSAWWVQRISRSAVAGRVTSPARTGADAVLLTMRSRCSRTWPREAGRQMAESWRGFLADVGDSVTIERHAGLAAARDVFARMAGGSVDPLRESSSNRDGPPGPVEAGPAIPGHFDGR